MNDWLRIGDYRFRISVYSAYFDENLEILTGSNRSLYFYFRPNENFTCDYENERCLGVIKILFINLANHRYLKTYECNFRYSDENVSTFPAFVMYAGSYELNRRFSTYLVLCPIRIPLDEEIRYPSYVGLTNPKVRNMSLVEYYIRIR